MSINKSNILIQKARHDLTPLQQKILGKIISLINSQAKNFEENYSFRLKDIKEMMGKTTYHSLKEAARQLSNQGFEIKKDDGKTEVYTRWVSSVITSKENDIITVEIPKEMEEYYLNLNNNFTMINATMIYRFKSKYSIRLYELLSSWKTVGKVKYKRIELKKLFKLKNEYSRVYDFKKRVLDVAQKEFIKKKSDIRFTYEIDGRGKNSDVIFTIKTVKNIDVNIDININKDMYEELKKIGLKDNDIKEITQKYDYERIASNLEYSLDYQKKGKIKKDIIGLFKASVENNYKPPKNTTELKDKNIKELTFYEHIDIVIDNGLFNKFRIFLENNKNTIKEAKNMLFLIETRGESALFDSFRSAKPLEMFFDQYENINDLINSQNAQKTPTLKNQDKKKIEKQPIFKDKNHNRSSQSGVFEESPQNGLKSLSEVLSEIEETMEERFDFESEEFVKEKNERIERTRRGLAAKRNAGRHNHNRSRR